MQLNTNVTLSRIAFAAAAVFSGIWVFGGSLGGINLEAATLFSIALGLLL